MRRTLLIPSLLLCVLATACSDRTTNATPDSGTPSADASSSPDVHFTPDVAPLPDVGGDLFATHPPGPAVDVLFVIDNSGSMARVQQKLRDSFGKMIDALKQAGLDGKLPDVHIGVVTTDLGAGNYGAAIPSCEIAGGDRGQLQAQAGSANCATPKDPWIAYRGGIPNVPDCTSADGSECVKASFSCIAAVGIMGCGFEMPLESARRALDPQLSINPGFLRDDALLALVFVTDEDDCSAAKPQLFDPTQQALADPLGPLTSFRCFEFGVQCDVNDRNTVGARQDCVPAYDWLYQISDYVDFFAELKGSSDRVVVAAIAGPTSPVAVGNDGGFPTLQPSCQTADSTAVPPLRIASFVQAFGGQLASICASDYGPALTTIGQRIGAKLGM